MPVTAFLGAYGHGNLGDELCLIEAMRAFPGGDAFALSPDAAWTMRCVAGLAGCFRRGPELLRLAPSRIVFGGGLFGTSDAFRAWMPWMARAAEAGAEIHLHNLGLSRIKFDLGWLDEAARGVIAGAASFTVRDYVSFEMAAEAGLGRMPRITFYPEADIPADDNLADGLLPRGRKLLGLSVIPLPLMQACLRHDAARVRDLLAPFAGHAVVPIASTVHRDLPEEDDIAGIADFLAQFLPDAPIAAPALLDRTHWRAELTPARLKGLIARCDTLVTQRKHNAIHAIGAGVRVIGLHPLEDDSLRRTFVALSHRLAPGSRCVGLDAPPEAAAA
ncbi:polysaccharide pyruvyl transferase family protein [Falsiroseomonas oryzae]|uniref:polysaccharide pyruvyl transferase family protein n=1 Tax=Falsiroseomonas oryzae TaxID=2766473 RepID=UPI0022EB5F72|nr:polysaccharide pyruvyl transferase family protein [Roseomonas sp. MO-31]